MPATLNTIRVFISSTFRDMEAEREELIKHIFPQLRKLCEARGVGFADVDLRWGVTEEQTERGELLPICLAEIDRCRPFFIGLLGERYGWVPPPGAIPQELIAEQPWLAEHREKSVTELEIAHGVLRNPEMASRAYFYFRDEAYLDQIPPEKRADFVETDPVARDKLAALKTDIRESGVTWKEYPDPKALGQAVLGDLTAVIDREFPPEHAPDGLEREALEHEAFAQSRMGSTSAVRSTSTAWMSMPAAARTAREWCCWASQVRASRRSWPTGQPGIASSILTIWCYCISLVPTPTAPTGWSYSGVCWR
ncbi:MAG: DUF4062 domain-containing protein, partial [Candidatus Eisenbacteria sp.]|nr:DUF4062 domain-containing protein [Candidatus Eisenbacteria bacterium]